MYKSRLQLRKQRAVIWMLPLLFFFTRAGAQEAALQQPITLTQSNASLVAVIEAVAKQSTLVFSYDRAALGSIKVEKVHWQATPLKKVMAALTTLTGIQYVVNNGTLAIRAAAQPVVPKKEPGRVTGNIIDEENDEPVMNASIRIGNKAGAIAVDGSYAFTLPQGSYTVTISCVGYGAKEVSGIEVKEGQATHLDITLKRERGQLSGIVVKATARSESVAALYVRQKNAAGISDGISAEQISRTPDKNMGEVLKRISGVATMDNRYVVIRGLSERYNGAMLNGQLMPSTELNRKQFSFDLIPANLIENAIVYKTVTPDISAEFGGGLLGITTKAIPSENFFSLTAGGSYNDLTTGKNFKTLRLEGSEYWGKAASHRNLFGKSDWNSQAEILSHTRPAGGNLGQYEVIDPAVFANNWGLYQMKAPVSQNYQLSFGHVFQPAVTNSNRKMGMLASISYRNTYQTQDIRTTRNGFDGEVSSVQNFRGIVGQRYGFTTNLGGLAGIGYTTPHNKISLQTLYLRTLDQQLVLGAGYNSELSGDRLAYYDMTTQTDLWQYQLKGEHNLGSQGVKLQWAGSYIRLNRLKPDNHNMIAVILSDKYAANGEINIATAGSSGAVQGGAMRSWVRAFENNYNWNTDLLLPFRFTTGAVEWTNTLKTGYGGWRKDRLLYVLNSAQVADFSKVPPLAQAFDPANNLEMHFSRFGDDFKKGTDLHAVYAMLDNRLGRRWRLVWGLRAEYYNLNRANQALDTLIARNNRDAITVFDYTALYNREKNWHLFPSANLTYSLTSKMNLRLAYAKSIIRPDLRELAFFREYDFELGGTYETALLRSTILHHYDFRYEWYPAAGEVLSLSLFYKKLNYPMEIFQMYGNRIYQLQNDKDAENKGIEIEMRKSFAFTHIPVLRAITIYGNATYLDAWVRPMKVRYTNSRADDPLKIEPLEEVQEKQKRPQMGASNFMYNASLYYDHKPVSATLSYNYVTNRTYRPADIYSGSLFERPLASLDAQLAVHLFRQKAELKVNVSNLLNNLSLVYANYNADQSSLVDPSKKELGYQKDRDLIDYEAKPGKTYSLTFTYHF